MSCQWRQCGSSWLRHRIDPHQSPRATSASRNRREPTWGIKHLPIDACGRRATPRPRRDGGERHARPRPRLLLRRDRSSRAARAAGQRLVARPPARARSSRSPRSLRWWNAGTRPCRSTRTTSGAAAGGRRRRGSGSAASGSSAARSRCRTPWSCRGARTSASTFSPTFQHEMINGVQQLAGVWPRFVNDHGIETTVPRLHVRVDGVGRLPGSSATRERR